MHDLTPFIILFVSLQHIECIPSPLFQDFLQLLTSLRCENGLPLQVALLAPPGRVRQMKLDSATQGTVGIMVRDFSLPASKVLFGKFTQVSVFWLVLFPLLTSVN